MIGCEGRPPADQGPRRKGLARVGPIAVSFRACCGTAPRCRRMGEGETPMEFEMRVAKSGKDGLVVTLSGSLDSESAPGCEARLKPQLDAGHKRLVFDLGSLRYISSAGLRLLISARKSVERGGGRAAVRNVRGPVAEVLRIANMIPADIAASEKAEDIYLDAIQRRESLKRQDVSD